MARRAQRSVDGPALTADASVKATLVFAAVRRSSFVFAFIGAPGFEPGTSPTRTVRATRLRHAPTQWEYSTRPPGLPVVAMPVSVTGPAAYHRPLDAHPEIGNNALIARALGAHELGRFAHHHGEPIGILASFPGDGLPAGELFERVRQATEHDTLVFDFGPESV